LYVLQECDPSLTSEEFPAHFFARDTYQYADAGPLEALDVWSYDTLFGAFQIGAWAENTNLEKVGINIGSSISGAVEVYCRLVGRPPERITCQTDVNGVLWLDIPQNEAGIIYPVLSKEKSAGPFKVQYVTTEKPIKEAVLSIVIPTFKREIQVIKNVNRISLHLIRRKLNKFKIIVVDNGNTLKRNDFSDAENIEIIANRNLGGAGGFARGLIETADNSDKFTDVLMCDDDADICPESISRAAALLSYAHQDIYIGGTMLYQHDRNFIHESGAAIHGPYGFQSFRQGLNVSKPWDVAEFDRAQSIQYFGWYMVAFPVSVLNNYGFPQPFFIRFDDQEYGLRLIGSGVKPVTLLGICVWHEAFHLRDSQITHYYLARNGLISLMLHRSSLSGFKVSRQLFKEFIRSLFSLRYDRANFILKGIDDALKGPDFVRNVDAERLNTQLIAEQTQKISAKTYNQMDGIAFHPTNYHGGKSKVLLAAISLGGNVFPRFFLRKKTFDYINSANPVAHTLSETIFYYEPITKLGWIAVRDKKRFFGILLRSPYYFVRLTFSYTRVGKNFKKKQSQLVSREMWGKHFTQAGREESNV